MNAARKIAGHLIEKFGEALPDNRPWSPVPGHPEAQAAWLVVVHDVHAARTHGDVTFDRNAPAGARSKALAVVRGLGIEISVEGALATTLRESLVYASMWTLVRCQTKAATETYCVEQATDRVFTRKGRDCRAEVESKRPHELRHDHRGALLAVIAAKRKAVFEDDEFDPATVIALGLPRGLLDPPKAINRLGRGNTIRNDEPDEERTMTKPGQTPMFAVKTSTKTRMVEIKHHEVEVDSARLLALLVSAGVRIPDSGATIRVKWADQKKAPAFGPGDSLVVGWDAEEVVEE